MTKKPDYSNFFYFNPLPSWVFDLEDLRIMDVNQAAIDHYGYSRDEFLSLTLIDLSPSQEVPKLINEHVEIENKEGNIYFGVFTHQKKDGTLMQMEINGHKVDFNNRQSILVVCQDVTEKTEQEEKLFQSEQRFKALVQEGGDLIGILDAEGKYLYVSPTSITVLGIAPEEFIGRSPFEFIHPDDAEKVSSSLQKIATEKKVLINPFRFQNKNKEWRWIETILTNMLNNPAVNGIVANSRDITEEKKLRELNRQTRELAKVGSWEYDLIEDNLFWSEEVHHLHETNPNTFIPNVDRAIDFYKEEHKSFVADVIHKSLNEGIYLDYEAVIITLSKKERWVRVIASPEYIDGKCVKFTGSFQDITDRKEAELAVLESEAKFKTIFEIASLGIIQVDPVKGRIILANSYYEIITGYTNDELLKMSFVELTHPDDREEDWELFSSAARGEGTYRNEKRYVKKDGTIVWVRLHVAFIRDKTGKPLKTVAICEDITERKEAEARLQSLSDNIPGVVFQYLLYTDGRDSLCYVSKGSEKIFGYSPEAVEKNIDLVWDQIKAGGDFEAVKQSVKNSIEKKSKWYIRCRNITPDGEKHILQGLGTPEFLPDGTVLFNSVVLDVTQEAKNEELLELATDLARIGSWEIDVVGNQLIWSDVVHELHETDPENFEPDLEKNINFYREDFRDKVNEEVEKCIEKGIPFDFEAVIITANGNERWVRSIGNAEMVDGKCQRVYGSFQDIHEQKIVESQKNSLLETLEHSLNEIFIFDSDSLQFIYSNKGALANIGYSSEEIRSLTVVDIKPEYTLASFKKLISPLLKNKKEKLIFFTNHKRKNGSIYPVEVHLQLVVENNKKRFLAITLDITERKKAEDQLNISFEEKNNILESISDAFYGLDKNWNITYFNSEAENLLKKKSEDVLGKNIWEKFSPAKGTEIEEKYRSVAKTGKTETFEYWYPGDGKWYEINAYPSKDGISAFFKNIEDRKKAAAELQKANERFEKVTEATSDAIWDWDIEKNTFYRSDAIDNFFGAGSAKLLSEEDFWKDKFHQDDLESVKESLAISLKDPLCHHWEMQYRVINDQDEMVYVNDRALLIRDKKGKATRMIGAMTDITERKKFEHQLLELNNSLKKYTHELELTNEELEQFAYIASHDLQEPLRMVTSFMDLLKRKYEDQLDDKALQYIHYATDGAKRMKIIIMDLLEYSRAGKLNVSPVKIDTNKILEDYQILRKRIIADKNVSLNIGNMPTLKSYIAPLTQTIHSLLDNAIKYSRKEVNPIIKVKADEMADFWQFSVEDNGIGIDPKFFEKIFIIFQRLHNKEEFSGTGIGLSIAKKNVESWGGKIWIKSTQGEGSTFYFTIPKTP